MLHVILTTLARAADEEAMIQSTQIVNSVIRIESTIFINRVRNHGKSDGNENMEPEYSYLVDIGKSRENGESVGERQFAAKRIILAGFSQGGVRHIFWTPRQPQQGVEVIILNLISSY